MVSKLHEGLETGRFLWEKKKKKKGGKLRQTPHKKNVTAGMLRLASCYSRAVLEVHSRLVLGAILSLGCLGGVTISVVRHVWRNFDARYHILEVHLIFSDGLT